MKVKKPAEKIRTPFLFFEFLKLREEEVAEEATEQKGSLLLISFTEQLSIFLTCLATEKGKTTLNLPRLFVVARCWKVVVELFSSLHSTATVAPAIIK